MATRWELISAFLCLTLLWIRTPNSARSATPSLAASDSCSLTWDCTKRLSYDSAFSVFPQIVATGDTIHLLWVGDAVNGSNIVRQGTGIQYSRSIDGGLNFSRPIELVQYDSASGGPGYLAVSGQHITMMYTARVPADTIYYGLAIRRSSDAGASWQDPVFLGRYNSWAIAAHGPDQYIYYGDEADHHPRAGMMVSHDYGESWTITNDSLFVNFEPASLVATSQGLYFAGRRHIITPDSTIGYYEVVYMRSTDLGYTWSLPGFVSTDDSITSQLPRIAADEEGSVYVVWQDFKYGSVDDWHGDVLMRTSTDNGQSWGTEERLTESPTAMFPHISLDKSSLAVCWNNGFSVYKDWSVVRVLRDYGIQLCDTVVLNTLGGDVDVSLHSSRLSAAWFGHDGEIYYRNARLGGEPQRSITEFLSLKAGWNLVSLPVEVGDRSKTANFPSAISPAFAYVGGSYVTEDSLSVGRGYWLRFARDEAVPLRGMPLLADTIQVVPGWNLIGSLSTPVSVNRIQTQPPGIRISRFFEYGSSYATIDTLEPGKGYWVKVSQKGELILERECDVIPVQTDMVTARPPPKTVRNKAR